MKFVFISILFLRFISLNAQQKINYSERINIIQNNIYKYYYDNTVHLYTETTTPQTDKNPYSYLWPLCALIQAANEQEILDTTHCYMQPAEEAIEQYYSDKAPTAGYGDYLVKFNKYDRYYDDNQWIAIAFMDAYNRTHDTSYFNRSEMIYRFMMGGYSDAGGGGLYWKENDTTTKNTCSNGPGILVALQLYKATNEKKYFDIAMLLYNWVNAHLLSPKGVYCDAIKFPSLKIDSAFYTYNTGTMLESNVLLYEITNDKKYLQQAQKIAASSLEIFYKNNRFPHGYWFNAVLLRGYLALYRHDKNKMYVEAMVNDVNEIWLHERDDKNLLGEKEKKELINQAAMLEIYARLQQWNLNK